MQQAPTISRHSTRLTQKLELSSPLQGFYEAGTRSLDCVNRDSW